MSEKSGLNFVAPLYSSLVKCSHKQPETATGWISITHEHITFKFKTRYFFAKAHFYMQLLPNAP